MLIAKQKKVIIICLTVFLQTTIAVVNQKSDSKVSNRREVPVETDAYAAPPFLNNERPPLSSKDDIEARISNFEATTPVFPLTAPAEDYGNALVPPKEEPVISNKDSSGYFYEPPPPNSIYGPPPSGPSYNYPKPSYPFPPKPSYGPPPRPAYLPPKPFFPKPTYGPPPPKPVYGPPKPVYGPPKPVYGPPEYRPPKPEYGPPPPTFELGPPIVDYGSIKPEYGPPPPKPVYGPPPSYIPPSKPEYRPPPPKPEYGPPPKPDYLPPPRPEYGPPPKPEYGPPPRPEYGPPPKPEYGPPPKPDYLPPKPDYLPPVPPSPPKPDYLPPSPPKPDYLPPSPPPTQYLPPLSKPPTSYLPPQKFEGIFPGKLLFPNSFKGGLFGGPFHGPVGISSPPTPPVVSYDGWRPMKVPEFKDLSLLNGGQLHTFETHFDQPASSGYEGLAPPIAPQFPYFGNSLSGYNHDQTVIGFPSGSYGVPPPTSHVHTADCDHTTGQLSPSGCCGTPPPNLGQPQYQNLGLSYGVPYGVPSGKQIEGPNLKPKSPIKFRPPVPAGLLESVGNGVVHGSSQSSTFVGQSYIPPAVPEVSKSSSADDAALDYSSSKDGTSFDAPGGPSLSLEAPYSPQPQTPYLTPTASVAPPTGPAGGDFLAPSPQPTFSVSSAGDYGSISPLPSKDQHIGDVPSSISTIDNQAIPVGSYGVPGQSFNLPGSGLGAPTSFSNSYQTYSSGGGLNPEFQSVFQSLGVNGQSISQSHSIELPASSGPIHEYPVQGNHGQYTLQIQSADGGASGLPGIPHDQVLSNGLLQDILSAIEHQNPAPASGFYDKSEQLLTAGSDNVLFKANKDLHENQIDEVAAKSTSGEETFKRHAKEISEKNKNENGAIGSADAIRHNISLLDNVKNIANAKYTVVGQNDSKENSVISTVTSSSSSLFNSNTPSISDSTSSTTPTLSKS